jgi:shikimate dehydrogenase
LPLLATTQPLARDVGAANTVLFGGVEGEWWGANTDVPGMASVLRSHGVGAAATVTILGGGATAASAVGAAADLGVAAVTVVARRPEAAGEVVAAGHRLAVDVQVRPWSDAAGLLAADAVVATVPAGASDVLASAVPARPGLLFDVLYAPWPTRLAAAWVEAGGPVAGGLELLVAQAAEQVFLMTGQRPPMEVMRAAGMEALAGRG